jgi:hypothetical protein
MSATASDRPSAVFSKLGKQQHAVAHLDRPNCVMPNTSPLKVIASASKLYVPRVHTDITHYFKDLMCNRGACSLDAQDVAVVHHQVGAAKRADYLMQTFGTFSAGL